MTDYDEAQEKDSAELARESGFTGTLRGFLEWLRDALVYGQVSVGTPEADQWGRLKTRVELVTGGYSSDEGLLGRVSRNVLVQSAWQSTHAGGLYVYEFHQEWLESTDEHEWLAPDDGVFRQIYRARTLRVIDADGRLVDLSFTGGIELAYLEADRDILNPAGVVIARPAPALDLPWAVEGATTEPSPATEPTIEELAEAFGLEIAPKEV